MMKLFLERDFVNYYNKNKENPVISNVSKQTTQADYFELQDDDILIYSLGKGVAKYKNPDCNEIHVINYESYVTKLPNRVKNAIAVGRDSCDLIVYTDNHFLLNELTDTAINHIHKKRIKAQSQLLQTLQILLEVKNIYEFTDNHKVKQCCFFSKQENLEPQELETAVNAFNRQNTYSSGFKTSNPDIEALGFEFWEFYGNQSYLL